jgi:hypothetical protein
VIFGEHNEHGFLGAPIAKHVIETYFAKKEGQPLPVLRRRWPAVRPRGSGFTAALRLQSRLPIRRPVIP